MQLPPHMDDGAVVRVVSRRVVRPFSPQRTVNRNKCHDPKEKEKEMEVIHLTPWDLRLISMDYIKKGIVLPHLPPAGGVGDDGLVLVEALASSLARALGRFYPFAGRLAAEERGDDGTVTLSLRCTGEGAEFVHAAAPGVAVADIAASLYTPPVVSAFFPLDGVLGADAALLESIPLVAVQVTELGDGVFIGVSMNHSAGDGATFWHLFNTWSEIHRLGGDDLTTPAPVLQRWFVESSPVPIPMPFRKLQDIVRRFDGAIMGLHECFFTFSDASVKKLKKQANEEIAGAATEGTISSLHAVLAHLWRAVCRARQLPPEQSTSYTLVAGCRGRVNGIPPGYLGNAMVFGRAEATVAEIVVEKGLGWTAWLLHRAAATSFDDAKMRESLERWVREPSFTYMVGNNHILSGSGSSTGLVSGVSDLAAFDVFGNNFGWGKPVTVRSGPGNKADGKVTVFEGPERGESVSLEVCLVQEVLARLVADEEFMDAVAMPPA